MKTELRKFYDDDRDFPLSWSNHTPPAKVEGVEWQSKSDEMYCWLDSRFELTFADKSLIAQFLSELSTSRTVEDAPDMEKALQCIVEMSQPGIPYYAYGDNEAACAMANRINEIGDIASSALSSRPLPQADKVEDAVMKKFKALETLVTKFGKLEAYGKDTLEYQELYNIWKPGTFPVET